MTTRQFDAKKLSKARKRILVVESHELILAGLRSAISASAALSNVELIIADSAVAGLSAANEPFDLVLLDTHIDENCPEDVLERIREVRAQSENVPVGIISASDSPDRLLAALDHGAAGVIPRSTPPEIVVVAIELMLIGGSYLPPQVVARLRATELDEASGGGGMNASLRRVAAPSLSVITSSELTRRQQGVLELVLKGSSNKEIARQLKLSVGTVKNYVSGLLKLARTRTRGRLVALQHSPVANPEDIR